MTNQERESYWRQMAGRQAKSGQSVKAFCRGEGICAHTLYIWRKRFRQSRRVKFAVVNVRPETAPASSVLELILSSGERLQIRPGADAATLRTVIAILRERA